MGLFQCECCGCVENTALSSQGFCGSFVQLFDWRYAPNRKGMRLCSACGPTHYSDGEKTGYGRWHNQFVRQFLPKGMFITNKWGNLAHRDTGEEEYLRWVLPEENVDQ